MAEVFAFSHKTGSLSFFYLQPKNKLLFRELMAIMTVNNFSSVNNHNCQHLLSLFSAYVVHLLTRHSLECSQMQIIHCITLELNFKKCQSVTICLWELTKSSVRPSTLIADGKTSRISQADYYHIWHLQNKNQAKIWWVKLQPFLFCHELTY